VEMYLASGNDLGSRGKAGQGLMGRSYSRHVR